MSPVCHGSQGGGDGSQGGGDSEFLPPAPEVAPQSPQKTIDVMAKYFAYVAPLACGFQLGGFSSDSIGLPPWFKNDATPKLIGMGKNAIGLGFIPSPPAEVGPLDVDQLPYGSEFRVTQAYDAVVFKDGMNLLAETIYKVCEHLGILTQPLWKTDEPDDGLKKVFIILIGMCYFLSKYLKGKTPWEI